MNPLKTRKQVNLDQHGNLTVVEVELEAAKRNFQRNDEYNRRNSDGLILQPTDEPRPIVEPLRTWQVGQFEGDLLEIHLAAFEWMGQRTVPLEEGEVDELREFLIEKVQGAQGDEPSSS